MDFENLHEKAEDQFAEECSNAMMMLDRSTPVCSGVQFMLAIENYLGEAGVPPAALQLGLRVPVANSDGPDKNGETEFMVSLAESSILWEVPEDVQENTLDCAMDLIGRIEKIISLWVEHEELGNVPDQDKRRKIAFAARYALVMATSIRVWGHFFGHRTKGMVRANGQPSADLDFWRTTVSDDDLARALGKSKLLSKMLEGLMNDDNEGELNLELGD
jgi:hypothetical protein